TISRSTSYEILGPLFEQYPFDNVTNKDKLCATYTLSASQIRK
ncbi:5248_t:CDS:1, partial [Scutellospora calospora]